MNYKQANDAYQQAWRGEGERLRKALRGAEKALLGTDAAADSLRVRFVFGRYAEARARLEQHDLLMIELMKQRDALRDT